MAIKYARRRLGVRSSKRKRANAKLRRRVSFSTSSARTRRVRYRRKARTSTGRLWKYVKKATRSEIKRFDAFCPSNPSYVVEKGDTLTSEIGGLKMDPLGRYLFIACASSHISTADYANYSMNNSGQLSTIKCPQLVKNQGWRMDLYSGLGLRHGNVSYTVVGNEIFLKYYSLKLMLHVQVPSSWDFNNYQDQKFELWWIEEKITDGVSNLNGSNLPHDLWDCMSTLYRGSGGQSQIAADFKVDGVKPTLKQLQRFNFAFRRKKLDLNTHNVKLKKLYSISVNEVVNQTYMYSGQFTDGSGVLNKNITNLPSFSPRVITKNFIIPVNRKLKIRDERNDQRFLNYTYWLLPMDSTLPTTNDANGEIFRVYMTCEGVFTDK